MRKGIETDGERERERKIERERKRERERGRERDREGERERKRERQRERVTRFQFRPYDVTVTLIPGLRENKSTVILLDIDNLFITCSRKCPSWRVPLICCHLSASTSGPNFFDSGHNSVKSTLACIIIRHRSAPFPCSH